MQAGSIPAAGPRYDGAKGMTMESKEIKKLRRELAKAQAASLKAAEDRGNLPAGSSRARVTTANARWRTLAEYRDRVQADLNAALDALTARSGAVSPIQCPACREGGECSLPS